MSARERECGGWPVVHVRCGGRLDASLRNAPVMLPVETLRGSLHWPTRHRIWNAVSHVPVPPLKEPPVVPRVEELPFDLPPVEELLPDVPEFVPVFAVLVHVPKLLVVVRVQ